MDHLIPLICQQSWSFVQYQGKIVEAEKYVSEALAGF
jgi:hypothetical protein